MRGKLFFTLSALLTMVIGCSNSSASRQDSAAQQPAPQDPVAAAPAGGGTQGGMSLYPLSAPPPGSMQQAQYPQGGYGTSPYSTSYAGGVCTVTDVQYASTVVPIADPPVMVDNVYQPSPRMSVGQYPVASQPAPAGQPYAATQPAAGTWDGVRRPSPYDPLFASAAMRSSSYTPVVANTVYNQPYVQTSATTQNQPFAQPVAATYPAPVMTTTYVQPVTTTYAASAPVTTTYASPPVTTTYAAPATTTTYTSMYTTTPTSYPAPVATTYSGPVYAAPAVTTQPTVVNTAYVPPVGTSPVPVAASYAPAAGEFRLVPALDIPPGNRPGDAAPSQWFEIIRPGNGPIRIGRVSATCVCVGVRVPNRQIAAGERALIEARTLTRPPVNNLTYGMYVSVVEPVNVMLDTDVTIRY